MLVLFFQIKIQKVYFGNIVFDPQTPKIHQDMSNIRSNHDPKFTDIITQASLILNIENLTQFLVLRTQMQMKFEKF